MSHRHARPGHRSRHHRHGPCLPGLVHRVTSGVGARLGIHRRWVLGGFIVALIVSFPVAIVAFLLAMFWVDHPGKLEGMFDRTSGWLRDTFGPREAPLHGQAAGDAPGAAPGADDFDPDGAFADLRSKFDDLERRAGAMEKHVSSDEYDLERELGRMRE